MTKQVTVSGCLIEREAETKVEGKKGKKNEIG